MFCYCCYPYDKTASYYHEKASIGLVKVCREFSENVLQSNRVIFSITILSYNYYRKNSTKHHTISSSLLLPVPPIFPFFHWFKSINFFFVNFLSISDSNCDLDKTIGTMSRHHNASGIYVGNRGLRCCGLKLYEQKGKGQRTHQA